MGAAMTTIPFDLVGFDLDGTLLDTSGDLAEAVNHALATVGCGPFPVEEIKPFVGRGAKIMLERALLASGGMDDGMIDELFPLLLDHYGRNLSRHTRPYPGLIAAMDALRARGVRLAICTNKRESFAVPLIAQLGLSPYFASIVGGDTAGFMKPDPAPLHMMVERAGGGRCIFLGDTINDIAAARAANIPNIAVSFGFVDHTAELGADAILHHYDDLVPMLERWPQ
jgi:phosphoglycolate phosphatase